jgi:hypothetical protein
LSNPDSCKKIAGIGTSTEEQPLKQDWIPDSACKQPHLADSQPFTCSLKRQLHLPTIQRFSDNGSKVLHPRGVSEFQSV